MRERRSGEPVHVGDVLGRLGRELGLDAELSALLTDGRRWAAVVGDDLAAAGRPLRWEGGVISLEAPTRLDEVRLEYAAAAIVAAVNESLGRPVVHKVVVRRLRAR